MKVLILGGTGAIGKYIVKELLDRNFQVFVTTRSNITSCNKKLKYIHGNAHDNKFLRTLLTLRSYDIIIDLMVYSTKQFLLRSDFLLRNCLQYIFVSTYRIFNDAGCEKITEESRTLLDTSKDIMYLKTDEYALSKARQEQWLFASTYENWTIVRPSISYSTDRFQFGIYELESFFPRIKYGLAIPVTCELLGKHTVMTWAGDTAKMICSTVAKQNAFRDSFNVVTSESVTWNTVSDIYREALGMRTINVDEKAFRKYAPNIWQYKYDRLFNRRCDNRKIISFSGLNSSDFKTVKEGINYELENYDLNNKQLKVLPRDFGRLDRMTSNFNPHLFSSKTDKLKYMSGRFALLDGFLKLKEKF